MRVIALVQARMGSRRFPQKMLAELGGRTILEWVLARVSMSKRLSGVVLTTTTLPRDDVLVQLAKEMKIKVFRGSESDVVGRFASAARAFKADVIVRICADNPFVDPGEIDRLIRSFTRKPCDYLCNHRNYLGSKYADGLGAEIFPLSSLDQVQLSTADPRYREHVTLYIIENTKKFQICSLNAPSRLRFPRLRFDVDTTTDLKKMKALIDQGVRLTTPARRVVEIARSKKTKKTRRNCSS